jgi:hypothetical protein
MGVQVVPANLRPQQTQWLAPRLSPAMVGSAETIRVGSIKSATLIITTKKKKKGQAKFVANRVSEIP